MDRLQEGLQAVPTRTQVTALEARILSLEASQRAAAAAAKPPVRSSAPAKPKARQALLPASVETAVRTAAASAKVDRYLLEALVWHESRGIATVTRYEPRYPHLWDVSIFGAFRLLNREEVTSTAAPADFPGGDREWIGQRTSWGACQLMGAVAREAGHRGEFGELLEPGRNLELCAGLLARLIGQTNSPREALAAFGRGMAGIEIGTARATEVEALAARLRKEGSS